MIPKESENDLIRNLGLQKALLLTLPANPKSEATNEATKSTTGVICAWLYT